MTEIAQWPQRHHDFGLKSAFLSTQLMALNTLPGWIFLCVRGGHRLLAWVGTCLWLVSALFLVIALPAATAVTAETLFPAPVQLTDAVTDVDAWPFVTVFPDASHTLGLAQVLPRIAEFTQPTGPYANLGLREETLWVHIPVVLRGSSKVTWHLIVDYVHLEELTVYEVCNGNVQVHASLGALVPFAERHSATRVPAIALQLAPGQRCDVMLKMRKFVRNAMLLPISFKQSNALLQTENFEQLWQGLLLGFGFSMVGYALVHAVLQKEKLHLWFAFFAIAGTASSQAYFGLIDQYLVPHSAFTQLKLPLLCLMLMASMGLLFSLRAINFEATTPLRSRAIGALAYSMLVLAPFYVVGIVSSSFVALALRVGVLVVLGLILPMVVAGLRAGGRMAMWTMVGWLLHGVGMLVGVMLHQGLLPYSWLADHAMQIGAALDLMAWSMVMSLRSRQIKEAAALQKLERDVLHQAAHTDILTGLLNRRGLVHALALAEKMAPPDACWTLYLCDLDGFKAVNDTLGHRAGDALLAQVASRLLMATDPDDLVCRLGGDEFVVVTQRVHGHAQALALGECLLACCAMPFELDASTAKVGITIGYATQTQAVPNLDPLLKEADTAMYEGKYKGKNCVTGGGG
jgi:diguanylate cyclase